MSRRLLPIFLIVLVDIFGFTLIIPLLSIYAERFDASALQATLLVSVFAVCQLVSGPILGRMSDRVGRKPLLIVSQIGTLIGFVILARASSLWMLYLARVVDGATAGNLSLAQAYISDNTAPKDRSKSFAVIGIAFGLGFFLGPFLTGYLVKFDLTAPIWAAVALSATSILCTTFLLPGGPPPRRELAPDAKGEEKEGALPGGKRLGVLSWGAYAQYFQRPILAGLLVQFFFYVFCFSTFIAGFALFAERTFVFRGHAFGPREIGYLFAYVGFLGIVLQGGLIGRLVKRFGEPALVHVGFATLVVSYVALGLIHGVALLIVVSTVSSFGNGVLRPTLTSLVTQNAGPHEQGVVIGLNQSLSSVASIFAPIIAGLLIGRSMLMLWAFVAAIAALLGLLFARRGSALCAPPPPV